jgi:hypothetical protein
VRRIPNGGSGKVHWNITEKNGQFPDELVKIEGVQIH